MSAHINPAAPVLCRRSRTVPKPDSCRARWSPNCGSLRVEVVRDAERLRELVPQWEALAEAALERNVFYEPFMVLPALEHLSGNQAFEFVFVTGADTSQPSNPAVLYGLFPLVRRPASHRFPMASLELWYHIHCFLCTPLVHRDCAPEVIGAFLDWAQLESDSKLLAFRLVSADGPFHQALSTHLYHRNLPFWVSINYVRAMMSRGKDAEHYLRHAISTRRLKEFRRQERRLAEKGTLAYKSLAENEDLDFWLQEFLRIEGSGWKGRNSSALCSSDSYRLFFQKIVCGAYEKNRLQMLAVSIDGKSIAQKCSFISGPAVFGFKIGFDERFRRYSPGVLLEIENIRCFHEDHNLEWMDSCADPGHPMIDSMWTERRTIQSLFIGLGTRSSHFVLAMAPLLRWLRHCVT